LNRILLQLNAQAPPLIIAIHLQTTLKGWIGSPSLDRL